MPVEPSANSVTGEVLTASTVVLDQCLEKIRHCLDQLNSEQVWWRPGEGLNSIGNLMLHLEGNLRQWIVAGLGGQEDIRNRSAEFSQRSPVATDQLWNDLVETVRLAKSTLHEMTAESMMATRRIQGFELSGWNALFDCLPHFQGHTQEIVCLTRIQLGHHYRFHWQPETPEQGASG